MDATPLGVVCRLTCTQGFSRTSNPGYMRKIRTTPKGVAPLGTEGMKLLASLRDAFVVGPWSGGVTRTSLNHRLHAGKPPACMIAIIVI